MFDVDPAMIIALGDEGLRELVRRLCAAELLRHSQPVSALTAGGHQNAPDGGIDVRVDLPASAPTLDFIKRPRTGFQVKLTAFGSADVKKEMCPKGTMRPVIAELGEVGGAYVIVSGKASYSDSVLAELRQVMADAMGDAPKPILDIYDGPRLAQWVNDHREVALWVRDQTHNTLLGWQPWGNWSHPEAEQSEPFLLGEEGRIVDGRNTESGLLPIQEGLRRMRSVLAAPRGVVRLIGLSGTGKTRLAQALFEKNVGDSALPRECAVYADLGASPTPSPQEMVQRLVLRRQRTVLVIDNCPPETHLALTALLHCPDNPVSLLTIEYDVQGDSFEGSEVFRLETASEEVIVTLLAQRHPGISQEVRSLIAELSCNNSRLALAIARNVPKGQTLARLTDQALFDRLFWQNQQKCPELKKAAEACALVYSFDVEQRGEGAELPILAALARMDTEELYAHVAELQRRQLVQQRGNWRAVLPHVLANRLAQWAIENSQERRLLASFADHPRLRKSFARRLGYLDDVERARAIAIAWLAPGTWLGEAKSTDREAWDILRLLAPTAPTRVLEIVERAIFNWRDGDVVSPNRWYGTHAEDILGALAYEPELFERCVLALAEFTAEGTASATRDLGCLFQIHYSGTNANMELRLKVLDRLLDASTNSHKRAGSLALNGMLKARGFDFPHHSDFGGRPRDGKGWWPGDAEAIRRWYAEALRRVEALALSENGAWARSLLTQHFANLWEVGRGVPEILEEMLPRISGVDYWPDAWITVRRSMRFIPKENRPPDQLSVLAERLAPTTQEQWAMAYVLTSQHGAVDIVDIEEEADDDKPWERAEAEATRLGREIGCDADLLDRLLSRALVGERGRQWSFGRGLADADTDLNALWNKLLSWLGVAPQKERGISLIAGFLSRLGETNQGLAQCFLEATAQDRQLAAFLPYLTAQLPLDDEAVGRLIEAVRVHPEGARDDTWFSLIHKIKELSEATISNVVASILERPNGLAAAVHFLSALLSVHGRNAGEILAACCRDTLGRWDFPGEPSHMTDHYLAEIAEIALQGNEGAETARLVCTHLTCAAAQRYLSAHAYPKLFHALLRLQPLVTLNGILGARGLRIRRLLWDRDEPSPLAAVPISTLYAWAEADRTDRYPALAEVAPLFDHHHCPEPIMLYLIENAPDRKAVLEAMLCNLGPSGGVVSELIAIYEARAKGMRTLFNHSDPTVRDWANAAALYLQQRADGWRQMSSQRNERFE